MSRWQRFKCWLGFHTPSCTTSDGEDEYYGSMIYVDCRCKFCNEYLKWKEMTVDGWNLWGRNEYGKYIDK